MSISRGHSDPLLLLYVYSNIQYFTHFCYTSLLIFNISLYGTFPKSTKIINFCYMSLLKHTFSILKENVAMAHVTKNHVIIEKQNYEKTIMNSITIDQHMPRASPPKIICSLSFCYMIAKMLISKVFKNNDFHYIHLTDLQNACLQKRPKSNNTYDPSELFTK